MKSTALGLFIMLFVALSGQLLAQDTLDINDNVFYSDTIATNELKIGINLSITNRAITKYQSWTTVFMAIGSDTTVELLRDSLILDSLASYDTTVNYQYRSSRFTTQQGVRIWVESASAGYVGDTTFNLLTIEYEPTGKVIPTVENLQTKDTLKKGDSMRIQFDFSNTGEIDYLISNSSLIVELFAMVNGEEDSKAKIGEVDGNLRARGRDQYPFFFNYKPQEQYLKKGGGNVVVVWPVGFLTINPDSTENEFYYDDLTSLAHTPPSDLSIYPNPVRDVLVISRNLDIESVRLFDMQGRDVSVVILENNTIPVDALQQGAYQLHLILKDGTHRVAPILVARD